MAENNKTSYLGRLKYLWGSIIYFWWWNRLQLY